MVNLGVTKVLEFIKYLNDSGLLTLIGIVVSVIGVFMSVFFTVQRTKNIQKIGDNSICANNSRLKNVGNKNIK
jgi:hypothetical protein